MSNEFDQRFLAGIYTRLGEEKELERLQLSKDLYSVLTAVEAGKNKKSAKSGKDWIKAINRRIIKLTELEARPSIYGNRRAFKF